MPAPEHVETLTRSYIELGAEELEEKWQRVIQGVTPVMGQPVSIPYDQFTELQALFGASLDKARASG